MLNEPPPEKNKRERRPHPLMQQPPSPEHQGGDTPSSQMVTLHIPIVKPYATYALIALNSIIYFIAFYIISEFQLRELYNWGANNHQAVLNFGEYHRLLTAMFLHGSLIHITFNMYSLYAVGQTVERFFGHFRFLMVYFLGGLAGSVLSVLLNPPSVTSVGASGAVFAIFGAEMVFLYKHRKLLGRMAQAQLRQLVIVAVVNFLIGFTSTLNTTGPVIDNWGHIGGFAGGIAIAWFISPMMIPKRHPTNPNGLAIDDINPLEKSYQSALAYVSVMLVVLIAATYLARGGL